MGLTFEWDPGKAARNRQKHGVSFEEAATVFGDPLSLTIADPLHSAAEDRFIILGEASGGRMLVVVHAERGAAIRIVSAREATQREARSYGEGGHGL